MICSVGYQLALYIAIRLAHRGSTVGELGLVCFGGIALTMELMNITKAKVRFLGLMSCNVD
jgi:dolichol kinase